MTTVTLSLSLISNRHIATRSAQHQDEVWIVKFACETVASGRWNSVPQANGRSASRRRAIAIGRRGQAQSSRGAKHDSGRGLAGRFYSAIDGVPRVEGICHSSDTIPHHRRQRLHFDSGGRPFVTSHPSRPVPAAPLSHSRARNSNCGTSKQGYSPRIPTPATRLPSRSASRGGDISRPHLHLLQ